MIIRTIKKIVHIFKLGYAEYMKEKMKDAFLQTCKPGDAVRVTPGPGCGDTFRKNKPRRATTKGTQAAGNKTHEDVG